MTGRRDAAPATTPRGRKWAAPLPSPATSRANRGLRFGGMEQMFVKPEQTPWSA